VELEISNLASKLTTESANERNVKLGQMVEKRSLTNFWNNGTPPYLGNGCT